MLSWSKEYKILDLQFLEREFMKRKGKSGCFSHNYKTNKKKAKKKNLTSETTCFLLPGPRTSTINALIYFANALHHFSSPAKFLDECKRVLKKNGLILLKKDKVGVMWQGEREN